MKSVQISALFAALLASSPAFASPANSAVNGILPGTPPPARLRQRTDGCNADNVLRDLRNPTRSASASIFCSQLLQSTVTTTTTNVNVVLATTTTSTATTTTSTSTLTETSTTITCAASPTTSVTCNFDAFGYYTYLISSNSGVDPVTCHENCLANPNCLSFQVQDGAPNYCNLFNAVTSGNVDPAPGGGFTFFDRNCPDYLPAQCTAAAPAKRDVPIPTYFPATVPVSRISSACSCFITSPSAPATVVVTQQTTTTSIGATATATSTETDPATAIVTPITSVQ